MTYEEKIKFCRENIGEKVEFSATKNFLNSNVGILSWLDSDENFRSIEGYVGIECRLVPKPKLIPWTLETAEPVMLRSKRNGFKFWMNYDDEGAWYSYYGGTQAIPYADLLKRFETVDGRPCGTEVKGE